VSTNSSPEDNDVFIESGAGVGSSIADTEYAGAGARYNNRVHSLASSKLAVAEQVRQADMVIGAVLVPGAAAPKLVSNDLIAQMKPGSVLVDIAIDQGGCFEDSYATTHADPTYQVHGSTFYCVANMPGAVPSTSTHALTNATLRTPLLWPTWDGRTRAVPTTPSPSASTPTPASSSTPVGAAVGLDAAELDSLLT
jgi:alanine dehydrogenase